MVRSLFCHGFLSVLRDRVSFQTIASTHLLRPPCVWYDFSQMLRPNKVLPLIKASQRSWILAGTSAGSRNSDGTCHPHGFSNADERDEHSKRIPPVSPPLSHLGNGVSLTVP